MSDVMLTGTPHFSVKKIMPMAFDGEVSLSGWSPLFDFTMPGTTAKFIFALYRYSEHAIVETRSPLFNIPFGTELKVEDFASKFEKIFTGLHVDPLTSIISVSRLDEVFTSLMDFAKRELDAAFWIPPNDFERRFRTLAAELFSDFEREWERSS